MRVGRQREKVASIKQATLTPGMRRDEYMKYKKTNKYKTKNKKASMKADADADGCGWGCEHKRKRKKKHNHGW